MAFARSNVVMLFLLCLAAAIGPAHLIASQSQAVEEVGPAKVSSDHFQGRIVTSKGPLSGAIAYVFQKELIAQSATSEKGNFEFDLDSSQPAQVLVVAQGMISKIHSLGLPKETKFEIQLQEQQSPPKFRIIDSQGMGVAAAKLQVLSLRGDLGLGLDPLGLAPLTVPIPAGLEISQLRASTDNEGWFQLPGIAPSMVGQIKVTGRGIVTTMLTSEALEKAKSHKVVLVAQPARTVVGKVVDRVSKAPISNVVITQGNGRSRAVADDLGKFELNGLPAFEPLVLTATSDEPYHSIGVPVPVVQGFDPTEVEIEMEPGVWVKGNVKDFATGKPASAEMYYFPTPENEKFQSFLESLQAQRTLGLRSTDPSGDAKVVAAAGPGVVVIVAEGFPADQSVNKLSDEQRAMLSQIAGPQLTAVEWIDPKDLDDEIELDFIVSKGRAIEVKLAGERLDTSDQFVVHRAASKSSYSQTIQGPKFTAEQFHPGEKRQVLIHGNQLGLGAVLELNADAESPVAVELNPTGGVIGRLVNKDGEPQSGLLVKFEIEVDDEYQEIATQIFTDANGRFEKPSLIATLDYRVSAIRPNKNQQMKDSPTVDSRWDLADDLRINSDEVVDLGSIVLGATEPPELKRAPRKSTAANGNSLPSLISGTITDESGEPIANAKITFNTWPNRSGELREDINLMPAILAQAASDSSGNFQISIESSLEKKLIKTSDGERNAALVVVAEKRGAMQIPLAEIVDQSKLDLKMNREMIIRGRVTTLGGVDSQKISLISGSQVRVYDAKTLEKIISSLKKGNSLESTKNFDPVSILDPAVGGAPAIWETSSSGAFLVRNVPFNAIFELHALSESGQRKTIMIVSRPSRGFEFTLNDDSGEKMQMQGSRVKLEFGSAAAED